MPFPLAGLKRIFMVEKGGESLRKTLPEQRGPSRHPTMSSRSINGFSLSFFFYSEDFARLIIVITDRLSFSAVLSVSPILVMIRCEGYCLCH